LSYYFSFTYCFGSSHLFKEIEKRTRNLLRPLIELLAGIPSVVYGFLIGGYRALNSKSFGLPVGETVAGSVVLAIMALPTIITISEDAMQHTACHERS
jgi:phosphate transport system permease protein